MDPKELKVMLKEAKDALKAKNFAEVVTKCKAIVKKEPKNYNANLYMGTAFKETSKYQQSLECYRKAVEIDPSQVYAWQGIILVYEKQNIKTHPDLLDAYKRIATFYETTSDKQKYVENTKKLANVLISQGDTKGALKVVTRLVKYLGIDLDVEVALMFANLLRETKWDSRNPEQNELYSLALETLVFESPGVNEDLCKRYFTQMNNEKKYENLVKSAIRLKDKWNSFSSPMEWLCRYYLEERLDNQVLGSVGEMDVITDKLFKLYPSSSYGHLARGKFLLEKGVKMNDGFGFIRTGLESRPLVQAYIVMMEGKLRFGDWGGAVEAALAGLRLQSVKGDSFGKRLTVGMTRALIEMGDLERVEEKLTYLKGEEGLDDDVGLLASRLYLKNKDLIKLKEVVQTLGDADGWEVRFFRTLAGLENFEGAKEVLKSLLELEDQEQLGEEGYIAALMDVSVLMYDLKAFDYAGELFVKVTETKRGGSRPLPWKYLGSIYMLQENVEMATKCYKRSYGLCATEEVGVLLSDCFFNLGLQDDNTEHLVEATKTFSKLKSKWAWLRLGVIYLNKDMANEAVNAFHACIRADINDCHVWESLGDAYCLRGSYQAALNSFNRALSLGADPMYPKFRIGVVYQKLDQHEDSVKTFKELLQDYPKNVPTLIEMARTYSRAAQTMAAENFDILAQLEVEKMLKYCVLAIEYSPSRTLLPWTLIAESPLTLAKVPESTKIKVPTFLVNQSTDNKSSCVEITIDQFKEVGTRALLGCLRIIASEEALYSKNLSTFVYHQLAVSYFNRGLNSKGERRPGGIEFFKKALLCAKKAVAADQNNKEYWNTLGLCAFFCDDDKLAQHCFIRSVELDPSNAVGWCNLGFLFLKHKEVLLAHKAFSKGQSVQPLYSYSWTGQGLAAEELSPFEAPDLFRHSTHLEPIPFAVSCYVDSVSRVLLGEFKMSKDDYWFTVERLDVITLCCDLITRIERRIETPHLLNLSGIVSALGGFYSKSLNSLTKALELVETDSQFALSEDCKKKLVMNRLALLIKMEKYEEARNVLATIEELGISGSAMGALTLLKLKDYGSAEALYTQLLQAVEDESDKLDVTIGLGLLYNEVKGAAGACEVLLKKSMTKNPHAMLALVAMGVLNGDADFVSNMLRHLDHFKTHPEFLADVALLKACFSIMKGNSRGGLNELLKLLRLHPLNTRLWTMASQIIFSYLNDSIPSSVCRKTTLTSLKLESKRAKSVVSTSMPSSSTSSSSAIKSSAMISLCHLIEGDWKTAKITALKGIKRYPEERENWIVLACAFWFQFVEDRSLDAYTKVISLLQKEADGFPTRRLSERAHQWNLTFLQNISKYRHLVC